jgi:hypothetical protein
MWLCEAVQLNVEHGIWFLRTSIIFVTYIAVPCTFRSAAECMINLGPLHVLNVLAGKAEAVSREAAAAEADAKLHL